MKRILFLFSHMIDDFFIKSTFSSMPCHDCDRFIRCRCILYFYFQDRSFECIESYKPTLRIFYRCASMNAIIQKLIMDVWSIIALILHFLNVLAFKTFYCCQNDRSVVMDSVRISFYQNKSSLLFDWIHVMDEND